jgi:3-hydroxybutyryl-CoA dehydratase
MNEFLWDDLKVGLRHEFEVVITREMVNAFAEISGDSNPLHSDPAYARRAGFDGQVVFGLLTSSFCSRLVGVYLPGKYALLHGIDIDFVSPVYVGDKLIVSGEIVLLSESVRRMEIKVSISNQAGAVVSKAVARVGLHVR